MNLGIAGPCRVVALISCLLAPSLWIIPASAATPPTPVQSCPEGSHYIVTAEGWECVANACSDTTCESYYWCLDPIGVAGVPPPWGAVCVDQFMCDFISCAEGTTCYLNPFGAIGCSAGPSSGCPASVNAGGPYSGLAGAPLRFDGSSSVDPEGDPLTFAWDFNTSNGYGVDAFGTAPVYTYRSPGVYPVALRVSDETGCQIVVTTVTNIAAFCSATVVNGYDTIRLGSGRPTWFASIQPGSDCSTTSSVIASSAVMTYGENTISAIESKPFVSDENGDGIPETRITFSKTDLRELLAPSDLGSQPFFATVTIEAKLASGGTIHGTAQVEVVPKVKNSVASVKPNPFNPSTRLTFTTEQPGSARITMFDVAGRLVRTILDERSLAAGAHDVAIDGRGTRGEKLSSGVYLIRGVSADGAFTKTLVILK